MDNETFKMEQRTQCQLESEDVIHDRLEEQFLNDERMQDVGVIFGDRCKEWCSWMDRQLQMVFPAAS